MGSVVDLISRYGSYGVLVQDSKIFLTLKKSGPFADLWGLPGGMIEFGETPEEALMREFAEEAALSISGMDLICTATVVGDYVKQGKPIRFHHIGIIFKVAGAAALHDVVPEEEGRWIELAGMDPDRLTPFAKQVLKDNV